MQICNTINSGYNNSAYIKPTRISSKTNPTAPAFMGINNVDFVNVSLTKGLNKLHNYTKSEYRTLTKEEINCLREEYESMYILNPGAKEEAHRVVSKNIKKYCDNEYGKGKYSIIIIGRSLSSIGKVLGYSIGEENVINIPLSRAYMYQSEAYLDRLKELGDLKKLKKFLKTQGLSKEKIENSDKKYIIMDYCVTGDSLHGAKKLLTREDVLGGKNIESLDVYKCISHITKHKLYETQLRYCHFKPYSFVDEAYNIIEIPLAMRRLEHDGQNEKLFRFKLLDNYMVEFGKKEARTEKMTSFIEKIKNIFGLSSK